MSSDYAAHKINITTVIQFAMKVINKTTLAGGSVSQFKLHPPAYKRKRRHWLVSWCTYPRNETFNKHGKVVLNDNITINGLSVHLCIFNLL